MFKKKNKEIGSVGNHKKVKLNEYYMLSEVDYNQFHEDYSNYWLIDGYKGTRRFWAIVVGVLVAFSVTLGVLFSGGYATAFQMFALFSVLAYIPYDMSLTDNIEFYKKEVVFKKDYVFALVDLILDRKVGLAGFIVENEDDGYVVSVAYYDVDKTDKEPLSLSFVIKSEDGVKVEDLELDLMYRICVDGLKVCFDNGVFGKTLEEIREENGVK